MDSQQQHICSSSETATDDSYEPLQMTLSVVVRTLHEYNFYTDKHAYIHRLTNEYVNKRNSDELI
jgi:hypothetical protein